MKALMDDKADIVVTSLKITPERNQKVEFSVPYLETGITIIVGIRDGAISATAFLGMTSPIPFLSTRRDLFYFMLPLEKPSGTILSLLHILNVIFLSTPYSLE